MASLFRSPIFKSPSIYRFFHNKENNVFLSFDDGPDPDSTPQVLEILEQHKVKAQFFVIGTKAEKQKALLSEIINKGHRVFSHSYDHQYRHYFQSENSVSEWIQNSLNHLEQLTGQRQILFRPPAGILTPPLLNASRKLEVPLILWNHRFFDTTQKWTEAKAQKSAHKMKSGDIILLHDSVRVSRLTPFLKTLDFYIHEIRNSNLNFGLLNSFDFLQKGHL